MPPNTTISFNWIFHFLSRIEILFLLATFFLRHYYKPFYDKKPPWLEKNWFLKINGHLFFESWYKVVIWLRLIVNYFLKVRKIYKTMALFARPTIEFSFLDTYFKFSVFFVVMILNNDHKFHVKKKEDSYEDSWNLFCS